MRKQYSFLVLKYEEKLKEGPTFICVCCGGLFFPFYVTEFDPTEFQAYDIFNEIYCYKQVDENNKRWICKNCKLNVFKI